MKNLKEDTKILLSRAYILAREDNYQHFDIITRMKECVDEIDQECKRRREKMEMKEIRIRKSGNGYQYEHVQDNGVGIATEEITGFEAIRTVVRQIGDWEEERKVHQNEIKDKMNKIQDKIAHQITQTLQTLVEDEY